MQPLRYDVRAYYRRTHIGTADHTDGIADEVLSTTGPYELAFVPGSETRELGEQGYTRSGTTWLAIADGCGSQTVPGGVFRAGDLLSDGHEDLYEVISVRTWPSEQTMTVRELP